MNATLTPFTSQPQATFIGKERNFAPVSRPVIDYPRVIDAEFDSHVSASGSAQDSISKPDQTQFIPTYDKQQQLQNLTYTAYGEFAALQQTIIEAPKILVEAPKILVEALSRDTTTKTDLSISVSSQRQAIDAFQNIGRAFDSGSLGAPQAIVDTFV